MVQQKDTSVDPSDLAGKSKKEVNFTGKTKNERIATKIFVYSSRLKRKLLRNIFLMRFLLISILIIFAYFSFTFAKNIFNNLQIPFYSSLVVDFFTTPPNKISSTDSRTNILLLGIGGEGHDAPELTDTLILMSVNHIDSSVKLISIPRDIWITDPRGKINNIYMYGNEKELGSGSYLAKAIISDIVGEKIHYYAVIDFSGFKRIIDVIGGVDIQVESSFTDNRFPIPGLENDLCDGDITYSCRYETISFEKGLTHMDGETALKFARSRHSEGDEGTDIARNARQQLVIDAVIKKVLTQDILLSKDKLFQIKDTVLSVVQTDIPPSGLAIIAKRIYENKGISQSFVLPQDLLFVPNYSPLYDNLYVFLPVGGNWDKIREWVDFVLLSQNTSTAM